MSDTEGRRFQGGVDTDGPDWRPLRAADMGRVQAISELLHPALPERLEVLDEKRRLSPGTCLGCGGEEIRGYGIAHPWLFGRIPALDEFLEGLPPEPDCLFVHDVALLPHARGRGAAARYIRLLSGLAHAAGLQGLACVAVYGSERLWSQLGFEVVTDGSLQSKLGPYGEAAYMTARL
ncbi:GNAT family N-acetyltransferase [Methylobacterium fujisawaense]